jgi:hypothetical protein
VFTVLTKPIAMGAPYRVRLFGTGGSILCELRCDGTESQYDKEHV